jgi:hypothetical protein
VEILAAFQTLFGMENVAPVAIIHPSQMKSPKFNLLITAKGDSRFDITPHKGVTIPGYICSVQGVCNLRAVGDTQEKYAEQLIAEVHVTRWQAESATVMDGLGAVMKKMNVVENAGEKARSARDHELYKKSRKLRCDPEWGYEASFEYGELIIGLIFQKAKNYPGFIASEEMFKPVLGRNGIDYQIVEFRDAGPEIENYYISMRLMPEFVAGADLDEVVKKIDEYFNQLCSQIDQYYKNARDHYVAKINGVTVGDFDEEIGVQIAAACNKQNKNLKNPKASYLPFYNVFEIDMNGTRYFDMWVEIYPAVVKEKKAEFLALGFIVFIDPYDRFTVCPIEGDFDYSKNFIILYQSFFAAVERYDQGIDGKLEGLSKDERNYFLVGSISNAQFNNCGALNASYEAICDNGLYKNPLLTEAQGSQIVIVFKIYKALDQLDFLMTSEMIAHVMEDHKHKLTFLKITDSPSSKVSELVVMLNDSYHAKGRIDKVADRIDADLRRMEGMLSEAYYDALAEHIAAKHGVKVYDLDKIQDKMIWRRGVQEYTYPEIELRSGQHYLENAPAIIPKCSTKYEPLYRAIKLTPEGAALSFFLDDDMLVALVKENTQMALEHGFVMYVSGQHALTGIYMKPTEPQEAIYHKFDELAMALTRKLAEVAQAASELDKAVRMTDLKR